MGGSTGTDTAGTGGQGMLSGMYDYVRSNPDVLLRSAGAMAPMFGASALSGPLNMAAGITGVAQVGQRNEQYKTDRAAAETAVSAFKKDPDTAKPPTAEQWILQAGGNVPQQRQAIAAQTNQDISNAAQQVAQSRQASTARNAAQPLRGPSQPQAMGGMGRGQIFAPTGSQARPTGANNQGGAQDLVARLIAAMQTQGGYKGYGQ